MSSADKSFVFNSFKMRHIELDDLKTINEILRIEHFDVGLSNLTIYYKCSDTKFWNCTENDKGEIIAVDIGNALPNGIDYGFALVVKAEYRGKGLSSKFTSQWNNYPNIGSSTVKSVQIFSDIFQCWLGKMLTMYGMVNKSLAQTYADNNKYVDVHLEKISELNISKVFAYDETIIKLDRKKFLKEYCGNKDTLSLCVIKNDKCIGYGVLKNISSYKAISPLYADNEQAAAALFGALVQNLDGEYLYVPAQAHQRLTLDFCKQLKLNFMNCEVRNCDKRALAFVKTLNMAKVFTSHDYWPV